MGRLFPRLVGGALLVLLAWRTISQTNAGEDHLDEAAFASRTPEAGLNCMKAAGDAMKA